MRDRDKEGGEIINFNEVKELTKAYLFPNYGREDLCFDHGEKEFLWDLQGNKYLDLVAGIAVNALGHAHPAVVRAVCEQSNKLMHVSNLYLIKEQAILAEKLASILPSPLKTSMYVNSGAEANEAALKLAVKHTGRGKVLGTLNSFHGRTSASLSATGQEKYRTGFEPLLSNAFNFVEYGDSEKLKEAVTSNTAAVILEPIQGEGGIIIPSQEFMSTARDVCTDKGALLIMDEVQTGMGRTGRIFAFEHFGIVPDIVTMAKALGNGFPIGAVASSIDISKTFQPGSHGTTFGGNPLGCAVASAVIDTLVQEKLAERAAKLGEEWMKVVKNIGKNGDLIREVRGKGLMIGVEMGNHARQLQKLGLQEKILINICAGKVVRLIPPLIVEKSSLE